MRSKLTRQSLPAQNGYIDLYLYMKKVMVLPKPDIRDQQRTWRRGEMVGYCLVNEVWQGCITSVKRMHMVFSDEETLAFENLAATQLEVI